MNTRIVRKGMAMLMALLVIMATGWALPDHSEARQVRNTTRTNVNRNVNRSNVNRNRNSTAVMSTSTATSTYTVTSMSMSTVIITGIIITWGRLLVSPPRPRSRRWPSAPSCIRCPLPAQP